MNAGQVAALVAAASLAVLACAGVYVLIKLARLTSAATGLVTEYRERTGRLIDHAQAAVDRTNEQLSRTDAITGSMDQVTTNMAELSRDVAALTGLARGLSAAAAAPLQGLAAVGYGLRRAVAVRRSLHVAAVAEPLPGRLVERPRQPDRADQRAAMAGAAGGPENAGRHRAVTGR